MKMIVVAVLALVVVAAAAPQGSPQGSPARAATPEPAKILRSEFDQQPDGPYTFNFESDDGISRQEEGSLKEVVDEENKPQTVVVVKGTYSFPGEDGKPVVVSYFADETGFHAEGDSIPKAA